LKGSQQAHKTNVINGYLYKFTRLDYIALEKKLFTLHQYHFPGQILSWYKCKSSLSEGLTCYARYWPVNQAQKTGGKDLAQCQTQIGYCSREAWQLLERIWPQWRHHFV